MNRGYISLISLVLLLAFAIIGVGAAVPQTAHAAMVFSVDPEDGAKDVEIDTEVKMFIFPVANPYRRVDRATVTSSIMDLRLAETGEYVSARVRFDEEGFMSSSAVVLIPDEPLAYGTSYEVTLYSGIRMRDGSKLSVPILDSNTSSGPWTWRFETEHSSSSPPDSDPVTFVDVGSTNPYRSAIEGMAAEEVISGYDDSTFRPKKPVWRAQFAKMICGALELSVTEGGNTPFTDLGVNDPTKLYPHDYISVAYTEGITKGTTATTFSPWTDISRAQVITMVVRAAKATSPSPLEQPPAGWEGQTANVGPPHGDNLVWAEFNGLTDGLQGYGEHWSVWDKMSRGEVSQVLWNLMAK